MGLGGARRPHFQSKDGAQCHACSRLRAPPPSPLSRCRCGRGCHRTRIRTWCSPQHASYSNMPSPCRFRPAEVRRWPSYIHVFEVCIQKPYLCSIPTANNYHERKVNENSVKRGNSVLRCWVGDLSIGLRSVSHRRRSMDLAQQTR